MKITPILNDKNTYINSKAKKQIASTNYSKESNLLSYPSNYYLSFGAIKQLRFEKAQSIAEAKAYGRRNLGIAEYSGFDDKSLDVINFINEGLVAVKNASRNKLRLPRYIKLREYKNVQMSARFFDGGEVTVNELIYHPENLEKEIKRIYFELQKDGIDANDEYLDVGKLSYDEKIDAYNKIRGIYEQTSQLNRFPKYLIAKMLEAGCWGEFKPDEAELFAQILDEAPQEDNFKTLYMFLKEYNKANFNFKDNSFKYKTIFHEVGHLQDWDIFMMADASEYKTYETCPKELKEWLNNKEYMQAAFEVSPYACYGPPEFIAESFAWLLEGKELPQKAQKLYKKLGGPRVVLYK